ncbi:MAG: Na+/H+ antiporter subunit E [Lautropia sp.]|nr:Na+/H+ antiporter subunit E [Lautropia sp.]
MKDLMPAPLLSLSLLVLWIMLNGSAAPAQLILGSLIGIGVPLMTQNLRPEKVRIKKPWVIIRLTARVFFDVIVSNLQVARHVWFYHSNPPRDQWVVIPLQLKAPSGLAALAIIAAVIPGTIWCELSMDRTRLLFHVFDVPPGTDFAQNFKDRYEKPLMEIFE